VETILVTFHRSDPEQMKENEYLEKRFQDFLPPGEKANEPASEIYYPIRKNSYPLLNRNDDISINKVEGVIGATFYWRDMLRNTLAEGRDGLFVVFENPCSPTFTYQIQ
jgi:hypothetical protein